MSRDSLEKALKNWQDKLAKYEVEHSITASTEKQFELEKKIENCEVNIQRLKARIDSINNSAVKSQTARLPPTSPSLVQRKHESRTKDKNKVSVPAVRKTPNLPEQPRETLSPFDSKFTDWQKSNYKDRIQLLCGQELQGAINWSENNSLNNQQFDFLIESIVWDSQRIKKEVFRQCWVGNEALAKPLYEKEMKAWFTSNCQDKSQLLCGQKLQRVIFWAEGNNLSEQESNFLINSLVWDMYKYQTVSAEEEKEKTEVSKFLRELWSKLQTKTKHPYKVVQEVLSWTGCQPFLTKKICQLICGSNSPIPEGDEAVQIKQIVQTHLNKDSQDQEIVQHFQVIYDRLLKNENHDSFWLLLEYRKILQQEEVTDAQILEVLLNTRLVVNQQEKLRVHNCIYQSIFNQDWLEIMILEDARPYAKKLLAWLDSNCQDQSQLLNEQELQEAVQWTKGKGNRLKPQEKKFIARSQALKFRKS